MVTRHHPPLLDSDQGNHFPGHEARVTDLLFAYGVTLSLFIHTLNLHLLAGLRDACYSILHTATTGTVGTPPAGESITHRVEGDAQEVPIPSSERATMGCCR